jgi:hypothetical protein
VWLGALLTIKNRSTIFMAQVNDLKLKIFYKFTVDMTILQVLSNEDLMNFAANKMSLFDSQSVKFL